MRQTVYIDLYFVINFIVDWFILMVAADLLRVKPAWWRLPAGAVLGSLGACLLFVLPPVHFLAVTALELAVMLCVNLIAFGYHTLWGFLKSLFVILVVTVIFGGVMLLLQYHTAAGAVMVAAGGAVYFDMPFLWFIGFSAAAWLVVHGLIRLLSWFRRNDVIYAVKITVDGCSTQAHGFLDTGNQLFDPLTNAPVMIAEYAAVRTLLPPEVRICYREGMACAALAETIAGSSFARRFRVVACRGAVGGGEMLPGFVPDAVEIITKKGSRRLGPAVIGVTRQSLSESGQYHLLLNPALM